MVAGMYLIVMLFEHCLSCDTVCAKQCVEKLEGVKTQDAKLFKM